MYSRNVSLSVSLLVCLQLGFRHDFFLPTLARSPQEIRDHAFSMNFDVISRLLGSKDVRRKKIALQWLQDIIDAVKDRNKMGTDVSDSAVLAAIDDVLVTLLQEQGAIFSLFSRARD